MSRLYPYRVRIYPTSRQIALIEENFSDARFVFNHMLDRNIKAYQRRKEYLSAFDMNYLLKSMKQYLPWLKKADSTALTSACADLDDAYQNFFHKKADFPRFKAKKHGKQSYRSTSPALKVDDKHVILPKIGPVRYRDGRNIPTDRKIQSITISRDTSDCYYASVLMKVDDIPHTKAANESIGLDLGIKEFLIDSTGNKIENPKFFAASQKKLAKAQKFLSRKKLGSHNYRKQKHKVAKIHQHIKNQRHDFQHKLANDIVHENQVICIESLRVKNMVKNAKLAKQITDAAWGEFVRMLEYKAEWHGRQFSRIDTFFPSSQICHVCGEKDPDVKRLSIREWTCRYCGCHHDRDINAAINIHEEGLRMLAAS